MYYIISILLILAGIGLAIYGTKKYNISLSLAFTIPNLAILFYIDEALNGSSYIKYGYYAVIILGLLVLLFAKIFTYVYGYFTFLFLLVMTWASFYALFDLNTENISGIESWTIIIVPIIVLVLIRKSIKRLVIGISSGYMLGMGVSAIGFKSILNMGWGYVMDAIYYPSLTILLFTLAGISYQHFLNKSNQEDASFDKKQVNLYFGGGSAIITILLIFLPLLLRTTPEQNARKLAKSYCNCLNEISNVNETTNLDELCKNKVGFYSSMKSISSMDDITKFSNVFSAEISKCLDQFKGLTTDNNLIYNENIDIKRDVKLKQNINVLNPNIVLGEYIGDFGIDTAILGIESFDIRNGLVSGYIKTLGEYHDTQFLKGPFQEFDDQDSAIRIALSTGFTTYDFYVDGNKLEGKAFDENGEYMYSFSLSRLEKPNKKLKEKLFDSESPYENTDNFTKEYLIQIKEGVTNVNVRDNYNIKQSNILTQVSYPATFTVVKEKIIENNSGEDLYLLKERRTVIDNATGKSYKLEAGKQISIIQVEGQSYKTEVDIGNETIISKLPISAVEKVKVQKWIYLEELNGWILSDFTTNSNISNEICDKFWFSPQDALVAHWKYFSHTGKYKQWDYGEVEPKKFTGSWRLDNQEKEITLVNFETNESETFIVQKLNKKELELLSKGISAGPIRYKVKDAPKNDQTVEKLVDVPFAVIENVPIYPGCENAGNNEAKKQCMSQKVMEFVQNNYNTKLAKDLGLEGRQRISVQFKINKMGNVSDVRARAPHPRLEQEAIDVVKSLPVMTPGRQDGKPVGVLYALPLLINVNE